MTRRAGGWGGLTQRECARLYAVYAPELTHRTRLASIVLVAVGLGGLAALLLGLVQGEPFVGAIGAGFLVVVGIMAVQARPMARERMLLLRGRVVELEAATSESGAEAVIAVSSIARLRPDGLIRQLRVDPTPQKLGIADAVYEELRAWGPGVELELVAGNDRFVLATMETARRRIAT